MLDFRRNRNVPNYLGANQQRRLLVLMGLAALVAILVFRSGDLRLVWRAWFEPADGPDPIALRRAGGVAPGDGNDEGPLGKRNALFPGVREDYLKEVQDDTVFRAGESDAWFHLLALLAKTDQQALEKASVGRVGHLQLDQQAASYRGRLVTIDGVVRSAKLVGAPENGFGIRRYYQLWLQPETSATALVVVYCLKLPQGFPVGSALKEWCTTTGFFFKRWAYQSQGGITTAPLILAATIDWQPPPPPPPPAPPVVQRLLWSIAVALVLALLFLGFFIARQRGSGRAGRLALDGRQVAAACAAHEAPANDDSAGAGDED